MPCHLSKSRYCKAVQCPKMLWLHLNKPECFDDSVLNRSVLDNGNRVGDLAMGLFGEYTEIPFGDLQDMLRLTEAEIEKGTPVIAEASFASEGLFCSADILRVVGEKRVELYEVKSSASVSDIYRHDVAFQYYVLRKCGYTVEKACLVHINNRYVRQGALDLQQLFQIEDLTEAVVAMQPETEARIAFLRVYLEQKEEPACEIGSHCSAPYGCGFFGHCTAHLPKPNIFDITGTTGNKKLDLYRKGFVSFADLLEAKAYAKDSAQRLQMMTELYDLPPTINAKEIIGFLRELRYPLYFLDFEAFNPAVPMFDGTRPYQQVPFQYSLHFLEEEGGELRHREFLAYPGQDPRRALAEQLCRDIPGNVCVLAYNMSFEKTVIRELAEQFPDLGEHLMHIHDSIADLLIPFRKKWYYARAMYGSYSIKHVLPALFPENPELDYRNLEGIRKGDEASAAFLRMGELSEPDQKALRSQLLAYCGLDTYAMVKVWEKLREAAS